MRIILTSENYKKLLASKNILIPKEIEKQMDNIANNIINYIDKVPESKIFINSIKHNKQVILNIYINSGEKIKRPTTSIYNKEEKEITFFPDKIKTNYTFMNIKPVIISSIVHEIIHYFDPKTNINNYDYKKKDQEVNEYYSEFDLSTFMNLHFNVPAEFDAYSKEVTMVIEDQLTKHPEIKDSIKQWLKSKGFKEADFISDTTLKEFLKRINPKNARRLKQRIWNDIKEFYP